MWDRLNKSETGMFGAATITVVAVIALTTPLLSLTDSNEQNIMEKLQNPVWAGGTREHLFGTNKLGCDVFSHILYGSRVTLLVPFVGAVVTGVVSVLLGLASGYKGGWANVVIIRLVDIQLTLPFILPALFIAAVFDPGLGDVILIAGLSGWVSYARLIRGEVLSIKEGGYVEALHSMGAGDMRVVLKYIPLNVISPVIVIAALDMARSTLIEASLSYFGLGTPIEIPTWGRMLFGSRVDMLTSPWSTILPGLFISPAVLGINLLGDWLQDYLDPRLSDWREKEGMNQHLLSTKDLSVTSHTKGHVIYTLENLDLMPDKRKKLGLVGELGSGKSAMSRSTLRLLAAPPARISGEILLEDEGLLSKKEEEMHHIRENRVSMVFRELIVSSNPLFTIQSQSAEVVHTHWKLPNGQLHEPLVQDLAEVGIVQPKRCLKQYPHALSGGMRQRATIAMALLCKPEVLITNEPTTVLDATIQAQIPDLLNKANQKCGASIALITHDLGMAAETVDAAAVIYAGEIAELSDVQDIFRHPLYPCTQELLQSIPSLEGGKKELQVTKGTAPSLRKLPKGCVFYGRCPYAHPLCNADPPSEVRLGDRLVRCFQYSGQW